MWSGPKGSSMQDRLDALTIFVAVAERQSFGEAARQLGRSPASVTRAVAALEERLQTRLFNRTTRSVALTDAGARYLDGCRRLLTTYDELEAVNFGERIEPRGWISITAPMIENAQPSVVPTTIRVIAIADRNGIRLGPGRWISSLAGGASLSWRSSKLMGGRRSRPPRT